MACSCLCSPLFHASGLNFQLIYNTSARIPSFGSAWADRKQRKQLSHTKPSLTVSLNYLCVFVFICPTKQVCISLASDTPQRASTGTAQRGSSGNTWLPEASPHSCIFFLCQFSADEMLKKKKKWYFSEVVYLTVIFPWRLDWQILSRQNGKEHSFTSDNHLCSINILPSTTVAQLRQVDWRDGSRNPRPLSSFAEPRPRRAPQFHEGSPCVFLQPAGIGEEEAGTLPYHISCQTWRS